MVTRREVIRGIAAVAIGASLVAAPAAASTGGAVGAYTTSGAWSFSSAPLLHPPKLRTIGRIVHSSLAPGDFLIDNFPDVAASGPMAGQGGPLILDDRLQPVWFHPVGRNLVSADLQQESYRNRPVLVWWQGTTTASGATLTGEVVVVDQRYRRLATVRAQPPWVISLHDAVISGEDIWVTVYRSVRGQDLVPYGGPRNGTVYDSGVQEYDLGTGKPIYTWDALNPGGPANVPLSASEQSASTSAGAGRGWDAYHVNSVQVLADGRILVSLRNTWAVYMIDTRTGRVVWTLGGRRSSFRFERGAKFAWQHDVRLVSPHELTLFDDHCCKTLPGGGFARPAAGSRGLVLKLDPARRTASLVAQYPRSSSLDAAFLGSMQLLAGGNALVGWGSQPFFTEYTSSGARVLDVVFPGTKDQSYRALFSATWVGTPYFPPKGAVRDAGGAATVYASWNGATEVTGWQVLGGSSTSRLRLLTRTARNGFETAIPLGRVSARLFEVRAVNRAGQVLGSSRPFS